MEKKIRVEVARMRWIGKNSVLEASGTRWTEKTNSLEASRTLRDDLEGLKHYACSGFEVGSSRKLVWRSPGGAGSAKTVVWWPPESVGPRKPVVWRLPGRSGTTWKGSNTTPAVVSKRPGDRTGANDAHRGRRGWTLKKAIFH